MGFHEKKLREVIEITVEGKEAVDSLKGENVREVIAKAALEHIKQLVAPRDQFDR